MKNNILNTIADYAKERVEKDKSIVTLEEIKEQARSKGTGKSNPFRDALAAKDISFICEIKKASPSKGVIDPVFDYLKIAEDYRAAGADCISCLTEPKWFLGSDEIFTQVRGAVETPMIRKDFVVDEYQIYQAKAMGADAVLLICSILDQLTVSRYLTLCSELGLAALVETHDEDEIRQAIAAGAEIIGVNNRNLTDFSVDISNAARLRNLVPADTIFVAESGIRGPEDIAALSGEGIDAVLIGETMMRAEDKAAMLGELRAAAK